MKKSHLYFYIGIIIFLSSWSGYAQETLNDEDWKLYPGGQSETIIVSDTSKVMYNVQAEILDQDSTMLNLNPPIISFLATDTINSEEVATAYLEVIQDFRIKQLLEKSIFINEKEEALEGYKVQVYFGSGTASKNEANDVKSKFIPLYPDVPVSVDYISPYFKVRVGNYRTRLEAEEFLNEIYETFPSSFIVKTKIAMPKLEGN